MTENSELKNRYLKCPFCPCIFLTETDLSKHLECMGNRKEEHMERYSRTHGRIEHGSGNAE